MVIGTFFIDRFVCAPFTSYSSSSSSSSLSLVDGNWSAWETWSTCSKTCGNGTRARVRLCNNPAPAHEGKDCAGEGNGSEVCLVRHCPGKFNFLVLKYKLKDQ